MDDGYTDLSDTGDAEPSSIVGYVMDLRDTWREDYTSNYEQDHDEYYRLWRAKWAKEDQQRLSERSRLISPALQQAVESSVAEVEEATFGRGKWFDLWDDVGDKESQDIEFLKAKLMEDFDSSLIRKDVSECLINGAVTGTGIGELVLESYLDMKPATRPIMDGAMSAFGVETTERVRVRLRPIKPNTFLIEPTATSIDDAVGVIIDEFVPKHQVEALQDSGVYEMFDLELAMPDLTIEPDKELAVTFNDDRVRLTKYYGKIPKEMLPLEEGEEETDESRYAEGVVVLCNEGQVLKAQRSPYMMKDRPVVAFPWDIVPDRFWGRGVCEKGYMSQKALDTELRARIDALGLVVHPMIAMDATRMPRGFKPEVRPGKVILTQGPPKEVLEPFKFGNLDVNSFTQTQALQEMVQQATGAIDSTGLLSSVSGDTKAGAVSMSLGAVIKRHKRTLINFQDAFLVPFIRKAAWRYMQFDPENYPVKDYKFKAASTLGIIAREYEVSQLISLLQTMSADSPLYPALIQSIVENMNLANREELIQTLQKSAEPSPEQQQQEKRAFEREEELHQAQVGVFQAQAAESNARAEKYTVEAKLEPEKVKNDLIEAITEGMDNNDGDAAEFDRRMTILDSELKVRDQKLKESESIHKMKRETKQDEQAAKTNEAESVLLKKLGVANG